MTTQRPDKYPEWATVNIVDPISGQNNVIEPPQVKKSEGWGYRDKGARNWFNWLGRYTDNWIKYLDAPITYTVASLPAATALPVGKMVFVTDIGLYSRHLYTDGVNWREVSNGNIVI
jgi:hypothetical protein